MKEKAQSNSKEEAYYDRNQAVMALAVLAMQQGYTVGVSDDPDEKEYKVLTIDLPTGQVGWHLPKNDLENWPQYDKPWDGHLLPEKRNRVKKFVEIQLERFKTP